MENIHTITHIPALIVHGRYDILCPLKYAYDLSKGFQNCQLVIADASGHAFTSEGKTIQRMACDQFLAEQNK